MPRPLKLKYHQATFHMLGKEPVPSNRAIAEIEKWEKRTKIKVPASIKEWYSLEGARSHFYRHEESDLTDPLHILLKSLDEANEAAANFNSLPPSDIARWHGLRGSEYDVYPELDGSDDPPVFYMPRGLEAGFQGPFSEFVFRSEFKGQVGLWDTGLDSNSGPTLSTSRDKRGPTKTKDQCGPIDLDFLRENFSEGPEEIWEGRKMPNPFRPGDMMIAFFRPRQGSPLPGQAVPHLSTTCAFYFYRQGMRVYVGCEGNPGKGNCQAEWYLNADSPELLNELAERVWNCGTISKTLKAKDKSGEALLRKLRRKLGKKES